MRKRIVKEMIVILEIVKQYGIELILGIITAGLAYCYKRLKKQLAKKLREHDDIKQGVVAILRQNIYDSYNKWSERGYCPIYAMEVITKVYEQYTALGGNHVGTELYERIKELPTQPIVNKHIDVNG